MPALELVAGGPAWVQDGGRPGHVHEGVPPGGALVPEWLTGANRAVGNPPDAAVIECVGTVVVAARGGDLRIAWDGVAAVLRQDHVRTLSLGRTVGYLAVAGGLDVPIVLGGRGLLAVAGLGGGVGRVLAAGDSVAISPSRAFAEAGVAAGGVPGALRPGSIRVVAGPDLDRFGPGALDALLTATWTVGAADRVGTRLVGPAILREGGDRAPSAPMTRGAIQVPGGGAPIVLGPDHPTTGGYPVLAVVIRADHGALAARAAGAPVRFSAVDLAEARAITAAWRRARGPASVAPGSAAR